MASAAIIHRMRARLRPALRCSKSCVFFWISCGFLIYGLHQFIGVSYIQEEAFILSKPAEDPIIKDTLSLIPSEMPNLPLSYIRHPYDNALYGLRKCGQYPALWDIKFNNFYWQVLHGTQASFYLYSAFYDKRKLTPWSPSLRILAMIDKFDPSKFKLYCQIWFEGLKEPVVTKVRDFNYIWQSNYGNAEDGILQPFLMRCHVPEHFYFLIPVSVSLSETPCGKAFNNLRVTYNPPVGGKKNIAVCVKGMDFMYSDHSVKLVEWLELTALLGADKVYLSVLSTHPNYSKVLDYYSHRGFVEVLKTSLPGEQPGAPSLIHIYHKAKALNQFQNELIPLNDCFYRNLYRYRYIALLDTDEVLVPKSIENWVKLLKKVDRKAFSDEGSIYTSFFFRNIYFLDDMIKKHGFSKDVPKYMHYLQHIYRAPNFTGPYDYVKGFHNTNRVLTLHNHLAFACLGECNAFPIDTTDGQLQHYRSDCAFELSHLCGYYRENAELDTSLWKYKKALISNTTRALKDIGFFKYLEGSKAKS